MTEEDMDGKLDLFLLLNVCRYYCDLGPAQRELFKLFVDGEDLSKEDVAALTLDAFGDILIAAVPFLAAKEYTGALLTDLEFLRYGYQVITEGGYY